KLFLGDTNPDGSPNVVNGWRQYGFNIDGVVSDPSSTGLCQPYAGALKDKVYQDGNAGIDNSFGENILPALLAINPHLSQQVSAGIQSGQFTLLFKLDGLGPSADYDPIATKLYEAAPLGGFAAFDGTDCWPVQPGFLSNPTDIESSIVAFPSATLASNVWSSN